MSVTLYQRGFTLIELMVVIAIISIFSSVALASLDQARSAARDSVRKVELREAQVAMELYYTKYGTYRVANAGWNNGGQGWYGYENGGTYTTAVSRVLYNEGFLPKPLYEDPLQAPGYMMYLCDGGNSYSITATLESPSEEDIQKAYRLCNGGSTNPNCSDEPGAQSGSPGGICNGTVGRYGKNYAVGF